MMHRPAGTRRRPSPVAAFFTGVLVFSSMAGGSAATEGLVGESTASPADGEDTGRQRQEPEVAAVAERAAAIVADWVGRERVPGAVLRISQGDRVLLERAFGFARLFEFERGEYGAVAAGEARPSALSRSAAPVPMTTATVFDLASVTKVMATTFAVMLLVDDGALDLDAAIRTYLPDFSDGGKGAITARHLLTHRSGMAQWQPTYYHAANADAAYAYVRDLPLSWPVGEGRHYSDLGFMVLGRVVERIAGRPLAALVHERLYAPLGLETIGFRPTAGPFAATSHGNPFEHRMVHDDGFGYLYDGDADSWNGWRRYTLAGEVNDGNAFHAFDGVAGHAGLFSTAADLDLLVRLLLDRGAAPGGRQMIRGAVVDAFLSPVGEGQALGWQVPDYAPAGSFVHTGFTGTYVLGVPPKDLAVVLLTNRQNRGLDADGQYPDVGELQRAVARATIGS